LHTQKQVTGFVHREACDAKITSTEILMIGFGLSVIPLIRELERDRIDYVVISSGDGIWNRLEKNARLDFDMVSSMHTSLYSFELVKRDSKDRYLPVKDYQAFLKEYTDEYNSKVISDWVTSVDNHATHSIVRTQGGRVFAAKHVVCATAFRRRMNQVLNEFDYASAKDKTIAITAIGDSVNLIISKLVPYNNRIVLVTNGSVMLDKLSFYDGKSYTLDQLEYHNVRHLSNTLYRKTFFAGAEFVVLCQKLFRFLAIEHLYFKHPLIRRPVNAREFMCPSPLASGKIVIKYWPIDAFQKLFDNDSLKESIRDGYLLNDLPYFLEQGLVEVWPKSETAIDREGQTIRWKDNVVKYDVIIEADNEKPNLPEIVVHRDDGTSGKYEYVSRNCYLGIVPKELNNIYFIGYTRPTTGGLASIVEMQCLFTHRLITDPGFHDEICQSIEQRIRKYDRYYRPSKTVSPTDHLVNYGFYSDDVARAMKINSRVWDCRSLMDLVIHFVFPNTAFKYRQNGPYKVEGVKEMIQQIYKDHHGFSLVISWLVTYALLQLTAYAGLIVAWYQHPFYLPTLALLFLLLVVWLNPVSSFIAVNGVGCNSYVNVVLVAALGLTALFPNPLIPLGSLVIASALTYAFRQLGWSRVPFNDLKNKKNPKYREFFNKYRSAFREVFAATDAAVQSGSRASPSAAASQRDLTPI
jgi:hypothetical protein